MQATTGPYEAVRRVALRAFPFVTLAIAFAAMAAFSWRKWPDVVVDFGEEPYAAWQLAQGKLLLRDVQWAATGPLSPYFNALLFRIGGPSLALLMAANLVLLVAIVVLLYRLGRELSDRGTATFATALFLVVFAFSQYTGIGNYNYVTPYTCGATHGILLGLLAMALAARHLRTGGDWPLAGAALCVGSSLLTKPEMFVAAAGALGVAAWLSLRRARSGVERARRFAILMAGVAAPAAVAFLSLWPAVGAATAARTTLLPWALIVGSSMPRTVFYLEQSGLDAPLARMRAIALDASVVAALLGSAIAADVSFGRRRRGATLAAIALTIAAGAAVVVRRPELVTSLGLVEFGRVLPILVAPGLALALVRTLRTSEKPDARRERWAMAWSFAALLLLKILLNARTYHYGFVLVMPAAFLVAVSLLSSIPAALRARGGVGWIARGAGVAGLVALACAHLALSAKVYARKQVRVGEAGDAFLADARGAYVRKAVRRLSADPGATLAVLPEGVMINYLTRRPNPTPYTSYLPFALTLAGGEERVLERLRRDPPATVLLVSRDASEHGATTFGVDYGRSIAAWLAGAYAVETLIGRSPFEAEGYGILILRRR